MYYITVRQSPKVRQMSIEELLFETTIKRVYMCTDQSATFTRMCDRIPAKYEIGKNISRMVKKLQNFNRTYGHLKDIDRRELYDRFYIPKSSGGMRPIDAPLGELKKAQRDLKDMFIDDFGALYHTSAFAYMKKRGVLKALQRHTQNNSKWYGKLDLSNFFGSTTLEFTISMLEKIYPFSEILSWENGRKELIDALELGFLDGGLPQGTPLSPALTNIIMIPIDFEFNKALRKRTDGNFVCTRYADDFIISSRYDFDINEIIKTLRDVMASFNAPYIIKNEKTRYGSSSGQNWNLGLMINGDNEITVGYKKKREFKAMLTNFILDTQHGKAWDLDAVQYMEGLHKYYEFVEEATIKEIVANLNAKFNADVDAMIKSTLRGECLAQYQRVNS